MKIASESDFSAAIASGLKEGETVISQADTHKDMVGMSASVDGSDAAEENA